MTRQDMVDRKFEPAAQGGNVALVEKANIVVIFRHPPQTKLALGANEDVAGNDGAMRRKVKRCVVESRHVERKHARSAGKRVSGRDSVELDIRRDALAGARVAVDARLVPPRESRRVSEVAGA